MPANVQKLIQHLQQLKSIDVNSPTGERQSESIAKQLLNLIFDLGINKTKFSEEDKKIIGPLLVEAIDPIQIVIESTGWKYKTRLESSVLRKRSSLQFLVDEYSSFPVGASNLSRKFQEANIAESIEILDKIIHIWRNVIDSDESPSDPEESGGSEVPPSHTWWF